MQELSDNLKKGSLLTATSLHNEMRFVTRNGKYFLHAGLEVVNPWNG